MLTPETTPNSTPAAPMPSARGAQGVLSRFFVDATHGFEIAINRMRVAIGGAIFLVIAIDFLLMKDPSRGIAAPAVTLGATGFGVAASLLSMQWLKHHSPTPLFLAGSVGLDALMVLIGVLPGVLWPFAGYPGQLHFPPLYFLLLPVVASGFRLSQPIVGVALGLNGLVAVLLIAADRTLNTPLFETRPLDVAFATILFAGAGLAAYTIASRTRTLTSTGALAVLNAERARKTLGVYVSEEVADRAMASAQLSPGGERQEMTILFSDLRGFTTYSETLSPEELVTELNAYLDAMVTVIRQEGGTVDKFIGDCIMVVYGLVDSRDDEAERAIRTAARMDEALALHNQDRLAQGRPPLRHGIGVHRGSVVVGNIGTEQRLQYTVIGDAVNTASRLESATKASGVSILISAAVKEAAEPLDPSLPELVPMGAIPLRGVGEPIEVYTLKGSQLSQDDIPTQPVRRP